MTVHEKLMMVQAELKAPKGQFNSFGKYKYRSCEDVLEAVKPLLVKNKLYLTITDEVVNVEGRFYIKATATVIDIVDGNKVSVSALAREDETKKGMDLAQVTGSVSSYARKYALNGLFCIDDTKDSDSTNTHDKEEPKPKADDKEKKLYEMATKKGFTPAQVVARCKAKYNKTLIMMLTDEEYKETWNALEGAKK